MHKIRKVIVHQNYSDILNDLALLELKTPLVFTSTIQAIPLETKRIPHGSEIIVSGWGQLATYFPRLPTLLQFTTVKSIGNINCAAQMLIYSNSLLCLAHSRGNGVCSGDSGGPAAHKGKLAGVAGFIVGDCGSDISDGFAKVSYHMDWINGNIGS